MNGMSEKEHTNRIWAIQRFDGLLWDLCWKRRRVEYNMDYCYNSLNAVHKFVGVKVSLSLYQNVYETYILLW